MNSDYGIKSETFCQKLGLLAAFKVFLLEY